MKIKNISINNWRSIKELTFTAEDLMIFIGQNNHGKSNILTSILFFFGEIKFSELDFYQGVSELYVEIEFTCLDEQDQRTFKKYLTKDNTFKVRKTAYIGGNFEYKGWVQNCKNDYLREDNASNYTKRELAMSLPFHNYLPDAGRLTKQDIIDAQLKFIEQNMNELEFEYELEETNFLGLKSVAKGIFGEIYFLPALKNASEDFSSKESSIFSRLFGDIIATMSKDNPAWSKMKSDLSNLFSSLNKYSETGMENENRPSQLIELENILSRELSSWGAKFDIQINTPDIDNIFKTNSSVWIDDGARTDISHKGHGLQRAITIALIQIIARKQLDECHNFESSTSNRASSKSRYFIFEEPELYLHPQAQRALFDSLVLLSESNDQVILCTHSSSLIDISRYKSIYIAKKENNDIGTKVIQCSDELFGDDEKSNWNLSYWINPDRSELFFAEKVILVEGATEKAIIPALAKELGVFKYSYTIIDCASKDNIPLYMKLLNKFNIPYIAIYDRDHQCNKTEDAKNTADKSSSKIEEALDNSLGKTIILENDIEEELGYQSRISGKPFVALRCIKDELFILKEQLRDKITQIYS